MSSSSWCTGLVHVKESPHACSWSDRQRNAGRFLVRAPADGGISSNTPLSTAVELGAKRVVVLPTGYSCALTEPPGGVLAMVLHALTLLIARQLVIDVVRWREKAEIVVVPPLCPIETTAYDFSASEALIRRAAASTREWLATGGLKRTEIPHELTPHDHLTI